LRSGRRLLFALGKGNERSFMPKETNLAVSPIYLTRKQMVEHLNRHGFPFSQSSTDKLCAPAVGRGPKVEAWLGKKPLYLA
jgi:uncharacterized membrane protein (UPF0127 family)